jgi:tRNA pseudouridine32 synthase/23S rRNA pseudouridine746 synthase
VNPRAPLVRLAPGWVAADKPAGRPTVPGRPAELHDCLWTRVQAEVPDALVVHRLDMATSGLVLFARGPVLQRLLSQAFAERRVGKHYVAVVDGDVEGDAGTITLPLAADWPNRPRQRIDPAHGKPSVTHWQVLERSAGRTRLRLTPLTGRTHQLRVHCLAIGHAIVGDTLYAPPAVAQAAPRLLLHAAALAFDDPQTGEAVTLEAPPPF